MAEPTYPFVPKSNRMLRVGQFWAVELPDGTFGALRILGVPAWGAMDRVGHIVGVQDWVGSAEPSSEDLAGRRVLGQAECRYDAVSVNGARILGLRLLDLDGIEPADLTSSAQLWARHVWSSRAVVGAVQRALSANADDERH